MMKSDEKAILVEKEGSDDPSFVVYNTLSKRDVHYPPQNESQKSAI